VALTVCAVTVLGWLAVATCFGDQPPRALVVTLFVVTMFGGPTSMVAFALARDYNRARVLGTASGVVNVGGFLATVIIAEGFGWVLDLQGGTTPHTLRFALLVGVAVQTVGAVRAAVWFRRVRAVARERQLRGHPVPVRVGKRRWWDLPRATDPGETNPSPAKVDSRA
jgi:F0F1-type ATP synthase assembly protein I